MKTENEFSTWLFGYDKDGDAYELICACDDMSWACEAARALIKSEREPVRHLTGEPFDWLVASRSDDPYDQYMTFSAEHPEGFQMSPDDMPKKEEPDIQKNHTFLFQADPEQILRDFCCISGACQLPDGYKVSYDYSYDSGVLHAILLRNGGTVASRTVQAKPLLTVHEAERAATDAITDYVSSRKDPALTIAVFSGLRPWNKGPRLTPCEKRYVFVESGTERLVHVDRYHEGCGYGPGHIPDVLGKQYAVTEVHDITNGEYRCQIVYIEKCRNAQA